MFDRQEYTKNWRAEHPNYYEEHKEQQRASSQKWRNNHLELARAKDRKYAADHAIDRCWTNILARCYNPERADFKWYGGRTPNPITVCERIINSRDWFKRIMGPKPSPEYSVERINNELGYLCGSCLLEDGITKEVCNIKWATKLEQTNNRRPTKKANDPVLETWWDWDSLSSISEKV